MKFIFYKTHDSENVINKTLTDPLQLDLIIRKDFDFYNPLFIFDSNVTPDINTYNYYVIPDMGVHGIIESVVNSGGSFWSMQGKVDVLESFKLQILNSHARINRGLQAGDYIDFSIDSTTNSSIVKHYSGVSISDERLLILTTVGGVKQDG